MQLNVNTVCGVCFSRSVVCKMYADFVMTGEVGNTKLYYVKVVVYTDALLN